MTKLLYCQRRQKTFFSLDLPSCIVIPQTVLLLLIKIIITTTTIIIIIIIIAIIIGPLPKPSEKQNSSGNLRNSSEIIENFTESLQNVGKDIWRTFKIFGNLRI